MVPGRAGDHKSNDILGLKSCFDQDIMGTDPKELQSDVPYSLHMDETDCVKAYWKSFDVNSTVDDVEMANNVCKVYLRILRASSNLLSPDIRCWQQSGC